MSRHGLTQQGLADLIGVSQRAVSDWCKDTTPRPHIIQRISEVLNISTDYLVDDNLKLPKWVAPLKVQIDSNRPAGAEFFSNPEIKMLKKHVDAIIKALSGVSSILDSALKK